MKKIIEILKQQGIEPVDEGDFLTFCYRNINFLYMEDERDKEFFSIYIPGIMQVERMEKCEVLEVINEINNQLKSVKLVLNGEYVWAGLEQKLLMDAEMEKMVLFSIDVLILAYHLFCDKWCSLKELN